MTVLNRLPTIISRIRRSVLALTLAGSLFTGLSSTCELSAQSTSLDFDRLDSLAAAHDFKMRYADRRDSAQLNKYGFKPHEIPTYHPTVYEKRLKEMAFVVPIEYNPIVETHIDVYAKRLRRLSSKLLGMEAVYLPMIEEVFTREGLPIELKYMAHIESALNPRAYSPAAAAGLWQFIASTGRMYGLRIDSHVDERLDPYKATVAAAAFLKDLHKTFGEWLPAIASYNSGPGRVSRAIRATGSTNFWKFRSYLPRETANYVPAFIGAAYVMHYPAEHNLYPIYSDFSYQQDVYEITGYEVSLKQMAELTGAPEAYLKDLNPSLLRGVVPYNSKPFSLRIPEGTRFILDQKITEAGSFGELLDKTFGDAKVRAEALKKGEPIPEAGALKQTYHTVSPSQTLERIALQYDVTESNIRLWNEINPGIIVMPGTVLKIYVPYTADEIASLRSKSYKQQQSQARTLAAPAQAGNGWHRVGYGDSLWTISQRYPGCSVERLMALNQIGKHSILQPGQMLKVN